MDHKLIKTNYTIEEKKIKKIGHENEKIGG